jgi:1,4-dihydroxy-6-naphthoate synthase
VNVARGDLGDRLADVSAVLSEAIRVGLDQRGEALEYAKGFGRGIDSETADRFVAMYVNELTRDYGEVGRRAVDELLRRSGTGVAAEFAPDA